VKTHEIDFFGTRVVLFDDGDTTQIVLDAIKKMNDRTGEEIQHLCSLGERGGARFFDIGAHVGLYAISVAKRGAYVTAVEPNPRSAELLRRNIEENGVAHRVTVVEKALWSRSGQRIALHMPEGNDGASSAMVRYPVARIVGVETISLRDLLRDVPLSVFVAAKIDVEGAEFRALPATPSKVLGRIDYLAIEYHPLDIDTGAGFAAVAALDGYLRANIPVVRANDLYKHFDYVPEEDV